jgi:hypothetical protein
VSAACPEIPTIVAMAARPLMPGSHILKVFLLFINSSSSFSISLNGKATDARLSYPKGTFFISSLSSCGISLNICSIHLIQIRIQHFRLNTDPDPDPDRIQGFDDQKLKKKSFGFGLLPHLLLNLILLF